MKGTGDQTELLLREPSALGRIVPWVLAAGALGFAGYLYGMVYRPLAEDGRKKGQELRETKALARDAKREVDEVKEELAKARKETADVREDLAHTSEAKDENAKLLSKLQGQLNEAGVELKNDGAAITVTMVDRILFASGEADLTTHGEDVLRKLGAVLKETPGKLIQVNGHTDNVRIKTEIKDLYPTNWELSAARAINVVRFLQDDVGVDPRKLMAAGYGPYRPIASNAQPAGRARNRRIEILLLPDRMKVVKGEFTEVAQNDSVDKGAAKTRSGERLRAAAAIRQKQATKKKH
jgi:chemotaxis protein MotB